MTRWIILIFVFLFLLLGQVWLVRPDHGSTAYYWLTGVNATLLVSLSYHLWPDHNRR